MAEPIVAKSAAEHAICAVAGGNHVTIQLDRAETDGTLDAIEVLARPGGGPPPHKHEFAEWFLVREGTLTICEERDGVVVPTREVPAGVTVADPTEPPATEPPGPEQLKAIAAKWGVEFWTGPVERSRTAGS